MSDPRLNPDFNDFVSGLSLMDRGHIVVKEITIDDASFEAFCPPFIEMDGFFLPPDFKIYVRRSTPL